MVHKWSKKGLVFSPQELKDRPEWMDEYAQAPNAVLFDTFVRVFFCSRSKPDANRQFVSYCAFVDLDRRDLTKVVNISKTPVMDMGGLGCFDEFGTYPVSVIKERASLIAYYGGWTRCESVPFNISLGCAVSSNDGLRFTKVGSGPVLTSSPGEPFVITSPKIRKYGDVWYLFYTCGQKWFMDNGRPEIIYKLRMAVSNDGLTWVKMNRNIMEDVIGENEAQACPDVILQDGLYHMFFCYRAATDFRKNKKNTYRIGYATSTDLFDWKRQDGMAGIDISPTGFDDEMVAYPNVFEVDGRVHMLYLGNEVGRRGFGLAVLEGKLAP